MWSARARLPLLASPFVFVYGELLPKNLFYLAPNKLLRTSGPLFLVCGIVFAPISATLWVMARGLQWLVGESPEILRLRLARSELQKVIDEGHEVGILHASQRSLSHTVIEVANETVARYCTPASRMSSIRATATRSEILRLARRHRTSTLLVTGGSHREITGYVRVIDVHLANSDWQAAVRPLVEIRQNTSHLTALLRLQTGHEPLARVVDGQGRGIGILHTRDLVKTLFGDAG
jgi:putative hemolysin